MATQPNYLAYPGAADLEDDDEQYDPDAEFTQDQQNAQIPSLAASAAPPGYIVGGGVPQPAVPPMPVTTTAPASQYQAFRIKGAVEKPISLSVPNYMPSPPAISPDDSGYAPASTPPVNTDLPLADLPAPFANRVIGKDTTLAGAQETARQIAAQQPIRPEPKWWNRAAAAALGGAAGYSNAAHRAAPINIPEVTNGLLYPGYEGKLASWQSRVNAANQQVQDLGQQVASQYAGQKIQSEAQLKAAQASAAMAHGQYWLSRSEQERTQWKIDPKSGELYNTISGQIATRPPTAQDRMQTAMALLTAAKDPDAQSKAAYYSLNGKLPPPTTAKVPTEATAALSIRATGATSGNPQIDAMTPEAAKQAITFGKDRAPKDPFVDWARQQAINEAQQKDLDKVGNDKDRQMQQISTARQAEIERTFGQGTTEQGIWESNDPKQITQLKNINNRFAPQMQAAADAFTSSARARGIQAPRFTVDRDTLKYTEVMQPPVAIAPPAPGVRGPGAAPPQQRLPIAPTAAPVAAPPATRPAAAPRPAVGQTVTVDGKPAVVTGINPQTGKLIVRFQ